MSKRILSLMLCFVMVFSMSVTSKVFAVTHESTQLKVIPDKTTASPGDVINYTIVMGPVSDLGSIQLDVVIPTGLTYVANSGGLADGLKTTLGFDEVSWTESSKRISGGALGVDYHCDTDTVLGTFQCKVNSGFSGATSVDLTNLEIYSCVDFTDHTSRFSTVPAVVNIESHDGNEPVYETTELKVTSNKTTANPGDTITYTITMGPVSDLGSMQMDIVIPDGLTYVMGSGKLTEGLQAILGFDALDFTEVSKMINGYASQADYRCDSDTELATFQCTVDDDYIGTAKVELTNLEFYSVETWQEHTSRFDVIPVEVTVEEYVGEPTLGSHQLVVTANKTTAKTGDVIDYTITMSPVSDLGSLQMVLDIPDSLTYVANSGRLADNLKETMGFDIIEYTEQSKMINGGALSDYNSDKDTVIAYFQCSVNEGYSGTAEVGLTRLEFYSCETWIENTSRYSVVPAVVAIEDVIVTDPVYESTEIKVTPDKTTVNAGETITYTITMGPVSNLGSLQMDIDIPEGLTYVAGSGKLSDGLQTTLGFDALDFTEVSKMINGYASAADYRCDTDTVLATFQCTADTDYSGTATVGLTNLEFYSVETWQEHTSRFSVVTTDVEVEAVAPPQTTTHTSYKIDTEIKSNPVTGDKVFNAGEFVYVDFTISSDEIDSLGAFEFHFTYDADQLNLLDIEAAIGSESGVMTVDKDNKEVKFYVDGVKPELDITGGKLVATAVFQVKDAAVGQTEIEFDLAKPLTVVPKGYEANTCAPTVNGITITISNIVITFVPGENALFTTGETEIKGRVNYNVPGFVEPAFTIPSGKLQAKDTYRMKEDTIVEPLWKVEGEDVYYTSEQLMNVAFTENVTLVAQVVKTYEVSFVAGPNGAITGTTSIVVDKDTVLTETQINSLVTPVANAGYVFESFDYDGTPITANTTITANFAAGKYTISTASVNPSIALFTGIENGDEITHGVDVVFQMTPVYSNITEIGYIIKGVKMSLVKDSLGNYTIPGDAIVDDVAIYVTTDSIYNVSFVSSGNGTVASGATYSVNKAECITREILDDAETKITAAPGYRFKNYSIDGRVVSETDLLARAVYGDVIINVNFTDKDYTLTDINGNPITVTHGTNFNFTPEASGAIVTNVVGVYESGAAVDITKNSDGSYTISGDDIIDNITLTAEKTSGSISFIFNTRYKALKARTGDADVKIVLIKTDKLTDKKYALSGSGATFYWSEKYEAYVYIVAGATANDGLTAKMIAAQLTTIDGAAEEVDYSGDMNRDGAITVNDPMIITDILHQKRKVETSILQKLMADIDGSGYVSTRDVDIVRVRCN